MVNDVHTVTRACTGAVLACHVKDSSALPGAGRGFSVRRFQRIKPNVSSAESKRGGALWEEKGISFHL